MVQSRSGLCSLLGIVLLVTVVLFPLSVGNAASLSITTTYDANTTASGNMFDVTVLSAADIVIDSFDIHLDLAPDPVLVNIYYRTGGYVGYEYNASAWTLVGSINVDAQGLYTPTHVPIGGIRLTAGETYGFYIAENNGSGEIINDTSVSNTYQDSNLDITTGIGQGWPEFTTVYSPRTWNGTIYYSYAAEMPQTGDPSGRFLWLYISLAFGFGATILWLAVKRFGLFPKK